MSDTLVLIFTVSTTESKPSETQTATVLSGSPSEHLPASSFNWGLSIPVHGTAGASSFLS